MAKKKKENKVDITKLDPNFLDTVRNAGKEMQDKKMSTEEDANQVPVGGMSKMPDEQAQALREKLVSKKTGANEAPVEDMQNQDPGEQPPEGPPEKDEPSMFGIDNFKSAFSFFGPRLAALVLGGETALETTDEMLKGYQREQNQGALSPYEQIRINQAQQRLNLAAQGERGRASRFKKGLDFKKQEAQKIPSKFLGEVVGKSTVLNQINYVRELSEKVGKDLRGPFSSRARSTLANLGISKDEGFIKLRTASKDLLAKYVKSITGAQMSDAEAKRLMAVVAGENDTYENFNAKLTTLQEIIAQEKDSVIKALEQQGYSAKGLSDKQRASFVVDVLEKKLRASEKSYGEKVTFKDVPVGRKFKKGNKTYIRTEQGIEEIK
mgnify:CR=1 FL=1